MELLFIFIIALLSVHFFNQYMSLRQRTSEVEASLEPREE